MNGLSEAECGAWQETEASRLRTTCGCRVALRQGKGVKPRLGAEPKLGAGPKQGAGPKPGAESKQGAEQQAELDLRGIAA